MRQRIYILSNLLTISLFVLANNAVNIASESEIVQQQDTIPSTDVSSPETIDDFPIIKLSTPAFRKDALVSFRGKKSNISLELISSEPNNITDDEIWFEQNQLSLPTYDVPNPFRETFETVPEVIPTKYRNNILVKAIKSLNQEGIVFLIYGQDFASGRYLFAFNSNTQEIEYGYDFSNYTLAPEYEVSDRGFIENSINWVEQIGDILYISYGHNTYAKSSKGMNAYITAIDTKNNRAKWHSRPLVSGTNFIIQNNTIISGYGFTSEPDYLYLLSTNTGEVLQQILVKSAPKAIFEKEDKLYVRTYNTNYVYEIKTLN